MTAYSLSEMSGEMFATRDRLARIDHACAASLTRLVDRLGRRIAQPPRVVLAGEFNSGKSTLANALLGTELLPTSLHANTRVPILVHYSPKVSLGYEDEARVVRPLDPARLDDVRNRGGRLLRLGLPVERLKRFELIDTPGLASGSPHLDTLVLEAFQRSHIAIWCTVASQAWKATEQSRWACAPRRLKTRSLLAVTHIDNIHSERDRLRLAERLEIEAKPHFAKVLPVAAVDARAARLAESTDEAGQAWRQAGGAALEAALLTALAQELATRCSAAERILARTTGRLVGTASVTATESVPAPPHHAEREPVLAA